MGEIDDDILAQRLIQCLEKHVGLSEAGKIARDLIRYMKLWAQICDRDPYNKLTETDKKKDENQKKLNDVDDDTTLRAPLAPGIESFRRADLFCHSTDSARLDLMKE